MVQNENSLAPAEPDGFPERLRQVIASYGSTSGLARAIERSEGAIRKWLRGQSEPAVSDLRTICNVTATNVEWLVMGRGDQQGMTMQAPPTTGSDEGPLPPLNYKLMDDVVLTVRLDSRIAGAAVSPEKCSSILTTVYNLSRTTRRVDTEAAERVAGIAT